MVDCGGGAQGRGKRQWAWKINRGPMIYMLICQGASLETPDSTPHRDTAPRRAGVWGKASAAKYRGTGRHGHQLARLFRRDQPKEKESRKRQTSFKAGERLGMWGPRMLGPATTSPAFRQQDSPSTADAASSPVYCSLVLRYLPCNPPPRAGAHRPRRHPCFLFAIQPLDAVQPQQDVVLGQTASFESTRGVTSRTVAPLDTLHSPDLVPSWVLLRALSSHVWLRAACEQGTFASISRPPSRRLLGGDLFVASCRALCKRASSCPWTHASSLRDRAGHGMHMKSVHLVPLIQH